MLPQQRLLSPQVVIGTVKAEFITVLLSTSGNSEIRISHGGFGEISELAWSSCAQIDAGRVFPSWVRAELTPDAIIILWNTKAFVRTGLCRHLSDICLAAHALSTRLAGCIDKGVVCSTVRIIAFRIDAERGP